MMFTIPENGLLTFRKRAIKYKKEAQDDLNTCYYPGCLDKTINSHILQKNGILSKIAHDRHLRKLEINRFKTPHYEFKRKGIDKVFSFNGFCNFHDNDLFKDIETQEIDFGLYKTFLKFSIRALYNEINRKEVIIKSYEKLLNDFPEYSNPQILEYIRQKKLGVSDLNNVGKRIWNDLNTGSESYVFKYRELSQIDICSSGFYTYETTDEIIAYVQKTQKEYSEFTNIFISFFPYQDKSILQMGYPKYKEKEIKPYFNEIFKVSEKRVYRILTNLLIFSENWVCSERFYDRYIKKDEHLFVGAYFFNRARTNERLVYDLNFKDFNFVKKFKKWYTDHSHLIDFH